MQESVVSICKEFPQTIDNPTPLADVKSNLLSLQGYFRNWSECNRKLHLMGGGSIGNVKCSKDNPKKKQKEIRSKQLRQLKKPSYLLSGISMLYTQT